MKPRGELRQPIETVPRDGKVVILEDDASGTYDVARWSADAGEWVGESDEPSKITPSHWQTMPGEKYSLQGEGASRARRFLLSRRTAPQLPTSDSLDARYSIAVAETIAAVEPPKARVQAKRTRRARRGFAIPVALAVMALIGGYFHADVADFLTRYPGLEDIFREEIRLASQELGKPALPAPPLQSGAEQARVQTAAQVQQAAEAAVPSARSPLEGEQCSRALEAQAALSRKADDEAAQHGRGAGSAIAELQQSLQQEREKGATLAQEASAARQALTASAEQNRRTREEARS